MSSAATRAAATSGTPQWAHCRSSVALPRSNSMIMEKSRASLRSTICSSSRTRLTNRSWHWALSNRAKTFGLWGAAVVHSKGAAALHHSNSTSISLIDGMSAFGTKRTCASALHMSAIGGKADIAFCGAHVGFFPVADVIRCPSSVRCWSLNRPAFCIISPARSP